MTLTHKTTLTASLVTLSVEDKNRKYRKLSVRNKGS